VEVQDQFVSAAGISVPDEPPLVHCATGVDLNILVPRMAPAV
jgi:hypothetical protein